MYNDYFEKTPGYLPKILEHIKSMDCIYDVPKFAIFASKSMNVQDVLDYIVSIPVLSKLRDTTEKAIGVIEKSIGEECEKVTAIAFDGDFETLSNIYACNISHNEEKLFDLLIQNIEENHKEVFDKIHFHNDWSGVDEDVRQKIKELLDEIYDTKNLERINRYIRKGTRSDLMDELEDIKEKLLSPILYRVSNKYRQLFDRINDNEIENDDIIRCGKYIEKAIHLLKKDVEGESLPSVEHKFWHMYKQLYNLIRTNNLEDGDLIKCEKYIERALSLLKKYDHIDPDYFPEISEQIQDALI